MATVLDGSLKVSKFELLSHYYIHFHSNTRGEGIQLPYPPRYRLNSITACLFGFYGI